MKHSKRPRSKAVVLAISLSEWRTRFLMFALSFLALLLLLFSHGQHPAVLALRVAMMDFLAPTVGFLTQPQQSLSHISEQWSQWQNVYTQNQQLREENAKLRQWYHTATEMSAENAALRRLLNLVPANTNHFLSGKLLGNLAGAFSQSQFLNIGTENGVSLDMPVISGEGLVGRVMEAGNSTSRVMLITDTNSRIAVITQDGRERAVAIGRNEPLLELRYLPEDTSVQPGEIILTSGDAELIPANIPVGQVVEVSKNHILVKPLVDWSRLNYVSLIASQQ